MIDKKVQLISTNSKLANFAASWTLFYDEKCLFANFVYFGWEKLRKWVKAQNLCLKLTYLMKHQLRSEIYSLNDLLAYLFTTVYTKSLQIMYGNFKMIIVQRLRTQHTNCSDREKIRYNQNWAFHSLAALNLAVIMELRLIWGALNLAYHNSALA